MLFKRTWRHVGLSFKKDMHGWPGPLFGAIIFSVFPKNHYKKLVFGGPNHSQRDPLSQAVILVRWGCSPSWFLVKNTKNMKKITSKNIKNTVESWSPAPGTTSFSTNTKKKKSRLNGIPNGPILKGFVTIFHKIIKKSLRFSWKTNTNWYFQRFSSF